MMSWTTEELRQRIAALPDHVKTDIICELAWHMFGGLGSKAEHIYPDHVPDQMDLKLAATCLRDELTKERPSLLVKEETE
jgi:hypothetical protein